MGGVRLSPPRSHSQGKKKIHNLGVEQPMHAVQSDRSELKLRLARKALTTNNTRGAEEAEKKINSPKI